MFDISGVAGSDPIPRTVTVTADGRPIEVTVRIDTPKEQEYYRHGGILQYVLRQMVK
jgi:aconitate hydratase